MERDELLMFGEDVEINFNSHAHVERDSLILVISQVVKISTHTLTWSVTFDLDIMLNTAQISTHTLTWSVTSAMSELP